MMNKSEELQELARRELQPAGTRPQCDARGAHG